MSNSSSELPPKLPLDVPAESSLPFTDAASGGTSLLLPLDVPAESSLSFPDAASGGNSLLPLETRVPTITSFGDAFKPLPAEEAKTIKSQLYKNPSDILVVHANSNIAITGKILRCLSPRHWLNDEVIDLYITLLKEREIREPDRHLKCHFFNTFFFSKLVNSRGDYNYDAVRRWTSLKSIGYHLKDCEKIFVPICISMHWSLVVINVRDMKFQYVDSLNGSTYRDHTDAVAKYFVDEVKDKSGVGIDVSGWTHEYVEDRPVQTNVCDCGMYMLKYIDFYSRGMELCFGQGHIPYFRLRTAKEILQLKAE